MTTDVLPRRSRATRPLCGVLAAGVLAVGTLAGPGTVAARPAPDGFADLVEQVGPAVVQITTTGVVSAQSDAPAQIPEHFRKGPFKDFFERFFGDETPGAKPQPPRRASGLGSGFIIDDDGIVVTNNHVVDGAADITVTLRDGREIGAEVLGTDAKTDLAVLRLETDAPLPAVSWGDSDVVRVGDWVVAMGNPFGLDGTVTAGIVSARGRNIGAGPYDDFIQIDAPINRGNSGGPLFDTSGEVVGVNTAIFSPSGGNVGIGFAIPAAIARDIVAELVETGRVDRGWLGVMIQPVTPDLAESLGLEAPRGALIARVEKDSPAAEAGLRAGDVVTAFDGDAIDGVRDLTRAAAAADTGDTVPLSVWREKSAVSLDLTVGAAPETVADARPAGDETLDLADMGIAVTGLTERTRARFRVSEDKTGVVVVDVDPDGQAARKGVRPGDVITQADGAAVDSPSDLRNAAASARAGKHSSVLMLIERDGVSRFVALPLADA